MNNIAAIRRSKKLTQSDLAEMAGVEQSTISKLERGSDSVTLRTIKLVADALHVPVADLFTERTDAERAIIEAYRSLPELRRKGWQDMAKMVASESEDDRKTPDQETDRFAG